MTEILIWILFPRPGAIGLTESLVVVLDVILLVRLNPEALLPKADPLILRDSLEHDVGDFVPLRVAEHMALSIHVLVVDLNLLFK